jgi:hypothetical protein
MIIHRLSAEDARRVDLGSDLSGGWFAGKELKTANYGASAAGRV